MAELQEAIVAITEAPEVRHIVSVSGGKDSAALAVFLKQKYPQIPAEYVFCDTGTELPETYEYLEKMEAVLGITIKKVNALEMLGIRQIGARACSRFSRLSIMLAKANVLATSAFGQMRRVRGMWRRRSRQ
jgi:tRNA(Ile)-lysidine synthase TilS/MesJ